MDSTYEGRQTEIRELKLPSIEVFANIYADRRYQITLEIPEFTAICPKTGLPDFGELRLTYWPDELCLELKSFKEYLLAYRNLGIFHENVVNRVLDDVLGTVRPHRAVLTATYNPRGGITTTVRRSFTRP
ncbi:MAG: NADPH-dependent 7-cyano-7-deazaguanine reductase QueF [Spirochaetales bacterium]|nr:NADPH-dependent 7-cyano-7-deazaguanine reductase QueF [Spirochaetales bacterium]